MRTWKRRVRSGRPTARNTSFSTASRAARSGVEARIDERPGRCLAELSYRLGRGRPRRTLLRGSACRAATRLLDRRCSSARGGRRRRLVAQYFGPQSNAGQGELERLMLEVVAVLVSRDLVRGEPERGLVSDDQPVVAVAPDRRRRRRSPAPARAVRRTPSVGPVRARAAVRRRSPPRARTNQARSARKLV